MGMGGNGNWIDRNGREWECWKPLPHISNRDSELGWVQLYPFIFGNGWDTTSPLISGVGASSLRRASTEGAYSAPLSLLAGLSAPPQNLTPIFRTEGHIPHINGPLIKFGNFGIVVFNLAVISSCRQKWIGIAGLRVSLVRWMNEWVNEWS